MQIKLNILLNQFVFISFFACTPYTFILCAHYQFLRFPSLVYLLRVKDQRRTKEEPRNDLRTTNHQKVLFLKIAVSFTSLIPCPILPREHRPTTVRRAKRYRALAAKNSALFLRLTS